MAPVLIDSTAINKQHSKDMWQTPNSRARRSRFTPQVPPGGAIINASTPQVAGGGRSRSATQQRNRPQRQQTKRHDKTSTVAERPETIARYLASLQHAEKKKKKTVKIELADNQSRGTTNIAACECVCVITCLLFRNTIRLTLIMLQRNSCQLGSNCFPGRLSHNRLELMARHVCQNNGIRRQLLEIIRRRLCHTTTATRRHLATATRHRSATTRSFGDD